MAPRAILLALAPALLGAALVAGGAADRIRPPLEPIPAARWQPRPGDVILTSADDVVGTQIRSASGDDAVYSHVGLVVGTPHGPQVIEATPNGSGRVGYVAIDLFTTDATVDELVVLRPIAALDAAALDGEAARLAAAQIPFDYELDADDPASLYCAELVVNLLRAGGVDLPDLRRVAMWVPLTGERQVIVPNAFALVENLRPVARQSRPAA